MSTRAFVAGLVACLAVMLALGGAIAVLNAGNDRPEGVAEDWLTAIGDTVRKGVEADATRRADAIGAPELAIRVLHPHAEEIGRKAGFVTLEVGKAKRRTISFGGQQEDIARVAFRVDARRPNDTTETITGVLSMERIDDAWTIAALGVFDPASVGVPELPSDGGPPPSSAPVTLWIGALVGAALIGLICSVLVRAATPSVAAA